QPTRDTPRPYTTLFRSESGIEAWAGSLLITTLKHGALYRVPLAEDGQSAAGDPLMYFNTQNRYRDLAVSPDGRTIYIATDNSGRSEEHTSELQSRENLV